MLRRLRTTLAKKSCLQARVLPTFSWLILYTCIAADRALETLQFHTFHSLVKKGWFRFGPETLQALVDALHKAPLVTGPHLMESYKLPSDWSGTYVSVLLGH
jgi:hypothetical protein